MFLIDFDQQRIIPDGELKEGFPTPSKKLELFSTTLKDWGWPEYATPKWIPSHVHWEDLDMEPGPDGSGGDERILLGGRVHLHRMHKGSGEARQQQRPRGRGGVGASIVRPGPLGRKLIEPRSVAHVVALATSASLVTSKPGIGATHAKPQPSAGYTTVPPVSAAQWRA